MVIGAAGELPKPPSTPIQFLEGACLKSGCQETRSVLPTIPRPFNELLTLIHQLPDMDDTSLAQAVSGVGRF